MTSKERVSAATRCQEVDHVPMHIYFRQWHGRRHLNLPCQDERGQLAVFRDRGWDAYLCVDTIVTPSSEVQPEVRYQGDDAGPGECQTWRTTARTLTETLRVTDDWLEVHDVGDYLRLLDDFRSGRHLKVPIETAGDLAALEYLLPIDNPRDVDATIKQHQKKRALADEFQVPLFAFDCAGMDSLIWPFPAEEGILRMCLEPELIHRLLDHVNNAYRQRLELLLDLGVDGIQRRGWCESADFWNPAIYRESARPALEDEIELTHTAGATLVDIKDTGVMPLLPELRTLAFDCRYGADPAQGEGDQDLRTIRSAFLGKALWGGISMPEHPYRCTPEETERAVEKAFADCGKTGFMLGPAASYRDYYSWENLLACGRAWRRLR
jgi:hypothetical protein